MPGAALQRATIRTLTAAIARNTPAAEICSRVVHEVRKLTRSRTAAIGLLASNGDLLDFVAAAGGNAEDIVGLRIRVADSLSRTVVETGKPLMVDGSQAAATGSLFADLLDLDGRMSPASAPAGTTTGATPRTAIVAPILQDGRVIGTISAMNKNDGGREPAIEPFTADDVEILEMFAEITALSRAVNATAAVARDQKREMAALYDAAQTVSASLNIQEVMENVLTSICKHLEHHSAILFLLNDDRTHLFIAAERGLSEEEREIQLGVEAGEHITVLVNGAACLLDEPEGELAFEDAAGSARALTVMIAPLRSRDHTHGILVVTSLQRRAYHEQDLKLLSAVAMQAGIAIDNAFLYEAAQRQAEETAALYELSIQVNSSLSEDRAIQLAADSVLRLLKADMSALMLYHRGEEALVTRAARNMDPERIAALRPRSGVGIPGWVYEWQTPQAISDVGADARDAAAPLSAFGVASVLCVPLQSGDEVLGVLLAMSARRRLYTVDEMELLYTIANQASSAIANAVRYHAARARSHEMRRYFSRIAQAIGSTLEDTDLPRLLADLCAEMMQADRCAVYRADGDVLLLAAASKFRAAAQPDAEVPIGAGLCGWVARRRMYLNLRQLDDDPRRSFHAWLNRDKMASYLAVPIRFEKRVVGVVEIYTQEPRSFTKEDVQLFNTFVRRARVAEKLIPGSQSRPVP